MISHITPLIQINMSYLFLVFLNKSGMLQMDLPSPLPIFFLSSPEAARFTSLR